MTEEKLKTSSIDETKQIRFLFWILLVATALLIIGSYLISQLTTLNLVAITPPTTSEQGWLASKTPATNYSHLPSVQLDSLLVRLISGKHIRLSKVDIALYVNSPIVKKEIQSSLHQVRDHLVFILSAQDALVFSNAQKQYLLESEIIQQLNLFLTAGKVKHIQLQQTFLN